MPRTINQQIEINASSEALFTALIKPSSIKHWWSASSAIVIPKKGGIYVVTWGNEDDPDYVTSCEITEIENNRFIRLLYKDYLSKHGGLPFKAIFEVKFSIEKKGSVCILHVEQTGFPKDPIADDYYEGCVKGWEDVLRQIRNVVE